MHPAAAVEYPYSDGRPMVESEAQLSAIDARVAELEALLRKSGGPHPR